ncbi:MAG TPA: hypothetical protein VM889_08490 [Candidatus Thermoplasmatota archaeon]|nr:hypothetical protein [Candidatus Thermoplasmatota archaeon]
MRISLLPAPVLAIALVLAGCVSPSPASAEDPSSTAEGIEAASRSEPRREAFAPLVFKGNIGVHACAASAAGARCAPILNENSVVGSDSPEDRAGRVTLVLSWKAASPWTEELHIGLYRVDGPCAPSCGNAPGREIATAKGSSPLTLEGEVDGYYAVRVWKTACVEIGCASPTDQAFRLDGQLHPMA